MTSDLDRRALLTGSGAGLALSLAAVRAGAQDASPATPTTPLPSIETLASTPLVDHIALSPDGKRIAAVSQKGDTKILVTFAIADSKPTTIIIGPEKVRDLFWGDNGHVILVDSVTRTLPEFRDRSEFFYARSVDVVTSKVRTFFSQNDGGAKIGSIMAGEAARFYPIIMGEMHRIKVKDEYRVTAANYRVIGDYNLCLYSFGSESSVGKLLATAPNDAEDFIVTPDGQVVAYSQFDDFRKEWTLAYNTTLGSEQQIWRPIYRVKGEALHTPGLIGLGADGKSVIISVSDADQDITTYHEIAADGVLGPPLDPGNAGKRGFPLFHPTTWRLAGFGHHDDTTVYEYTDPLMKKLYESVPKLLGEGYRSYPVDFAEDPRQMLVYSEGDGDAGSYYFADFTTGNGVQVGTNYPNLPSEWVTQKQPVEYKAADGLSIHGYLTLPPFREAKNLPLVVLPHGGPQARDDIDFDWQAQTLASRGYAVLQPNFRGSSGYGQTFVNAGHGEWGRKMQTDLSDGVRWLAGKGLIDLKRVAIMGASYGGYAAMAGATLDPGVYNCAVAIAGVSDLKAMVDWEDNKTGNIESSTVLYWRQFMGDPTRWDEISPARQAARAYCPLLLIHGTDDTVVPIAQSQRMEAALKAAGKPVEFVTYKGQDHWETVSSIRVAMMQASVDFLMKHNPV